MRQSVLTTLTWWWHFPEAVSAGIVDGIYCVHDPGFPGATVLYDVAGNDHLLLTLPGLEGGSRPS